jgi:hypothetical protein
LLVLSPTNFGINSVDPVGLRSQNQMKRFAVFCAIVGVITNFGISWR